MSEREEHKMMLQLSANLWITVHVLYTHTDLTDNKSEDESLTKVEGPFAKPYEEVVTEFSSWVNFVREDQNVG
jgi:hypothetical protein